VWDITEENRGWNNRYSFFLPSFIYVFFFVIRKNTTTTINIQRDWQKRLFYLDFILNASSSLLCYASIALCSLFFFHYTHAHTYIHYIHRLLGKKKREKERERKKKQDCLPANNHVNCRTHVYTPLLPHRCARSLFIVCHFVFVINTCIRSRFLRIWHFIPLFDTCSCQFLV